MDLVTWRLQLARTGFLLRLRSLFSILVVFGGVGVAIGYSIVDRLARGPTEDEDETRSVPE